MLVTQNILITPEILALISRIDEFKAAWRALGTLAPDRLLALRRVTTIESIGSSSRIEGSQLSDQAVEALLAKIETPRLMRELLEWVRHMRVNQALQPLLVLVKYSKTYLVGKNVALSQ